MDNSFRDLKAEMLAAYDKLMRAERDSFLRKEALYSSPITEWRGICLLLPCGLLFGAKPLSVGPSLFRAAITGPRAQYALLRLRRRHP
jgi:hypothetical protein